MKKSLILSLFFTLLLSSCEQDIIREMENTTNEIEISSNESKVNYEFYAQAFKDAPLYTIETERNLINSLASASEAVDNWLAAKGWEQDTQMSSITEIDTRAISVKTDTVWERNCWVFLDDDVQKSMYFKTKLNSKIVDAINAKIDRKYWLSTKTTYRCEWQVMGIYRILKENEQFAMVDSPLSGLHPDTRTDFWTRNCKLYTKVTSTGETEKCLISYRLNIISTDTDKPKENEWYQMYWPAEMLDSPFRGYQFIYRILTR